MPDQPLLHIVLFQPEIPQNTGNIGRTCVAVNAKLWLVRPLGFRLDETRLRRAGMDYWQHLDWEIAVDFHALTERLAGHPMWLMTKTGQRSYTDANFARGDVLVFGSESQGLPPSLLGADPHRCLRIPMRSEARSLNLACSVAVTAYEALRQIEAPER